MAHLNRSELAQDIDRIKDISLECSTCPPDRNCCANFHLNYGLPLSRSSAHRALGHNTIDEMLSRGDMVTTGRDYKIVGGECPLLSEEGLCSVHEKKKDLELHGCMEFPVYVVESMPRTEKPPIDGPLVIVDYRCFGIEKNWDSVAPELETMSHNYDIEVRVKYLLDEGCRLLLLKDFNEFRGSGGVPSQRL